MPNPRGIKPGGSRRSSRVTGAIDMVGHTYGRLNVLERASSTPTGQATWRARCVCGAEVVVSGALLRRGHTQSCGCLHREIISTHGKYKTRTYRLWGAMKSRCVHSMYYTGVSVCPSWAQSYEAFVADMGECPEGLTLDRIDNTKGYEPGNCRWATMKEQVRNRRTNKLNAEKADEIRRDTRSTSELAHEYGVHAVTIREVRKGVIWA